MRYELVKNYSNVLKNCCNVSTCNDTKPKSADYCISLFQNV